MRDTRKLNITDKVLQEINDLLDWRAMAPLPDGRILGKPSKGKRDRVNPIPDKRISLLNRLMPLAGLSVLEVGCFEGIHTMGLLKFSAKVTAIDLRPVNVLKTLARLSLSGQSAPVFVGNCEELDKSFGRFDVAFHFGVLYHLSNPVQHLRSLGTVADTLYIDTHFAPRSRATETVTVDGETYDFAVVGEQGWGDPFSGADPTAAHLSYAGLKKAIISAGFVNYRLLEYREERHGPRVLVFASRAVDVSTFPVVPDPVV